MRSEHTPSTVIAGQSAPIAEPFRLAKFPSLFQGPQFARVARIQWLLLSILAAAIVGGGLLSLRIETLYQAKAVVKIPVPFKLSARKLQYFGTGWLFTNGIKPGKGSAVTYTASGNFPEVVTIVATSDSPDNAIQMAGAAAVVARNQDLPFFDKVLLRDDSDGDDAVISLGMPHIAKQPMLLLSSDGDAVNNTRFLWQTQNDLLLGAWLTTLTLFAMLVYFAAPDPNKISRLREARREMLAHLKVQFTPAANADADVPTSESLKVIAGVELVSDLTHAGDFSQLHPVLLDTSSDLWTLADDQNNGKELLFLRARSSTTGSRAAMLAIGRAFARRGHKTVMLDADLTATLAKRDEFGFGEDMPGLLDLLISQMPLSGCLVEDDDYPGLTGICAGTGEVTDGYADMLLESEAMLDLLDYLAAQNDIVLIHGPCGLDCGAITLAKRAGATLIVGPEERSKLDTNIEDRTLVGLSSVQANVLGRVEVSRQELPSTQIAI